MSVLYQSDFVAWADQQASLLENERWSELDLVNLAEEVRDLAGKERDAIESQLIRLIAHLLKWQYQPERRCSSWEITIKSARLSIERLIRKHPSLKAHIEQPDTLVECQDDAIKFAAIETGLEPAIFEECPSLGDAINPDFWP